MRVETKVNIIIGSFVTVAVTVTLFLLVLIVNEAFGTRINVGEPYTSSYSYCQTMSYGAKGSSWCSKYATGYEQRQRHTIKGLFFDGEGDHLVDNR